MATFYFNILVFSWYIAFFVLIVILHLKNSLEYNSKFKNENQIELPKFNGPHLLSFLMYKKITPSVFTSTVIILVKKGAITIKESKKGPIFIDTSDKIKMSRSQKYIIEILFTDIAEDGKLTLDDIYEAARNNNECSMFLINFQIWKKMMYKEIATNNYYEPKKMYDVLKWYRNLTFIILILNYFIGENSFNGYFIIAPAYFLLVSFYYVFKRTKSANDEYYKWSSFKKHLIAKESSEDFLIPAIILHVSRPYAILNKQQETIAYQLHTAFNKLITRSILHGNRSLNANRDKWSVI